MSELTDPAGMIIDDHMMLFPGDMTMREMLLKTWQAQEDTQQIMNLAGLTEEQVCEVIPKKMWVYTTRRDCPKCRGRGYFTYLTEAPKPVAAVNE